MSDFIHIREYAAMHSLNLSTLYKRVRSGAQPGGQLIGGDWYISADEPMAPIVTRGGHPTQADVTSSSAFDPAAYVTVSEAATLWGMTERAVTSRCKSGRISGAHKRGRGWLIPRAALDAQVEDKRVISGKYRDWRKK